MIQNLRLIVFLYHNFGLILFKYKIKSELIIWIKSLKYACFTITKSQYHRKNVLSIFIRQYIIVILKYFSLLGNIIGEPFHQNVTIEITESYSNVGYFLS